MQPLCWVIGTFLLSALLPWPSTGQFHVIGPNAPIIALTGEDAVLSCHLKPVINAQNMEVRWYRHHSSGLVHRYGASQDQKEQQMPEYQGRTGFLKENITKGQAALRIHSIRPSDGGEYSCFFESSTYYDDAIFEVLVTGSGVAPHIHIEPSGISKVKLTCTSTGWYPEPEVQWRDLKGQLLIPDSETKTAEGNGLFRVETSVTMDKNPGGVMSCLIKNPVLNEEKEVRVSVAGALFPYPWIVALAVILSLLVVALIFGIIYAVFIRKAKGKLKEENEQLLTKEKEAKEEREYIKESIGYIKYFLEEIKKQNEEILKKKVPVNTSSSSAHSNQNPPRTHPPSKNNIYSQESTRTPGLVTRTSEEGTHLKARGAGIHRQLENINHPLQSMPDYMLNNKSRGSRYTPQAALYMDSSNTHRYLSQDDDNGSSI